MGEDLDDPLFLTITTCTLSSNGNSDDIIKDGLVPSFFTEMVKPLNSTTNREAMFMWKVFQLGRPSTTILSCKMILDSAYAPLGITSFIDNVTSSDNSLSITKLIAENRQCSYGS